MMTYAALREASLSRIEAAIVEETRATALQIRRNDRNAIKRMARRYIAQPSRLIEVDRFFRSYPELLDSLDMRISFRSSWERRDPIMLRGAMLAVKVFLRRERAEAMMLEAAE